MYESLPCLQTAGEAQYTTDIPTIPGELAAAFAVTTQVSDGGTHDSLSCFTPFLLPPSPPSLCSFF